MQTFVLIAVWSLAFANGSNDNFKGVATLRQSSWYSFRRALGWATAWTMAGALASLWLAGALLPVFSGASLIASHVDALQFLGAVAAAAALTVVLASRIGMPISTTHALLGALTGTAILSAGWEHGNLSSLGSTVALPLLVSPLLAMGLTHLTFPLLRRVFPVEKDCVCLLSDNALQSAGGPEGVTILPAAAFIRDTAQSCAVHGSKAIFKTSVSEGMHWMSAGWISFSRGVNDTAKIAGLLLLPEVGLNPLAAILAVTSAMAIGGLLGARPVARTVSEEITAIPLVEGAGANLATAALVTLASQLGLAVSTTHVSVGSILGVAQSNRQSTDLRKVRQILLSWLVTLPLAALAGALIYRVLSY